MTAQWPAIDDRERLDRWWKQLQAVFGLPIPDGFPLAGWAPDATETAAVERYLELIPDLFNSTALAGNFGWALIIDEVGSEHVDSHSPEREALRALAPLFRQFHAPNEKASFKTVYAIVSRQANADPGDTADRQQQLRTWTRAANRLTREWLEHLVAAVAGTTWPADHGWPVPADLIDQFFYAEHLHWEPEKAKAAKQHQADAFLDAWHQHLVLRAVAQLSYLYISFASVVAVASGSVQTRP